MTRPSDITYADFTSAMSYDSGIALRAREVLAKLFRKVVGKTLAADQSQTSDATTQTALTGLRFYVKKGKKYRLQALLVSGGTAGGIKASISGPASTALRVISTSHVVAGSATAAVVALDTLDGAGAASNFKLCLDGYLQPIANGYVQINFAQAASNATASVVYAGSWATLINVR